MNELQREHQQAAENLDQAKQRVRAALVSIGYVEADPASGQIGCIVNDMVTRHPDVLKALAEEREAQNRVLWKSSSRQ